MGMRTRPLLIILLFCPACLSVTVSSSKPNVEVHEHTDAVLSCEFRTEKDQNPRIEWKKKGKGVTFVYFNNKFTSSYASRAKIEGATLTIHSVTQKDSGDYRCEVTASDDHVNLGEATVTLNVLVPPHIPSCEVPSPVFVGSSLELHCKDKQSVPPATYRWYKDNKGLTATQDTPYNIDPSKGTLKFKSISKLDAGMYRCESSNNAGAPKSCVAQQLKIIDYPLNLTILIAGAAGLMTLFILCCVCVCVCRRRGCCANDSTKPSYWSDLWRGDPTYCDAITPHLMPAENKKSKGPSPYSPPPPPTRNLKTYKPTQSFMI